MALMLGYPEENEATIMCGRFILLDNKEQIAQIGITLNRAVKSRYNIAPSQDILAARLEENGTEKFVDFAWGLRWTAQYVEKVDDYVYTIGPRYKEAQDHPRQRESRL